MKEFSISFGMLAVTFSEFSFSEFKDSLITKQNPLWIKVSFGFPDKPTNVKPSPEHYTYSVSSATWPNLQAASASCRRLKVAPFRARS